MTWKELQLRYVELRRYGSPDEWLAALRAGMSDEDVIRAAFASAPVRFAEAVLASSPKHAAPRGTEGEP